MTINRPNSTNSNTAVTTKVAKQAKPSSTDMNKPNATLSLCLVANYLAANGKLAVINVDSYESFARTYNDIADKGDDVLLTLHVTDSGIGFINETPDELKDAKIAASVSFDKIPVKANLHIQNLGKNAYEISLDDARPYKISMSNLFILTDTDKEFIETNSAEGADFHAGRPLPAIKDTVDAMIKTVYSSKIGDVLPAKRGTTSKTAGTTSSKQTPLNVSVGAPKKNIPTRTFVPKEKQLMLQSNDFLTVDVSGNVNRTNQDVHTVLFKTVETPPGKGYFSFCWTQPKNNISLNFMTLDVNPITGVLTILIENEESEGILELLAKTLVDFEYAGETIHDIQSKASFKGYCFYNKSNYRAYTAVGA
jgi:hypothetical protein